MSSLAPGEKLVDIPNLTNISPNITRILGQNPSKFSLQGTNSYLLSPPNTPSCLTLIDTTSPIPHLESNSPNAPQQYLSLLLSCLNRDQTPPQNQQHICNIILSHHHQDHVGFLAPLLKNLEEWRKTTHQVKEPSSGCRNQAPKIWKFKDPSGINDEPIISALESLNQQKNEGPLYYTPPEPSQIQQSNANHYINWLTNDQTFPPIPQLKIIHTPGHTDDSICILAKDSKDFGIPLSPSSSDSNATTIDQEAREEGKEKEGEKPKPVLFTGDTILGQGTTVFESLIKYMGSLKSLETQVVAECSSSSTSISDSIDLRILPAHGPTIENGLERIKAYYQHRMIRENQVLEVLAKNKDQEGGFTSSRLVSLIYPPLPPPVRQAAVRGLNLHLDKLRSEGLIEPIAATVTAADTNNNNSNGEDDEEKGMDRYFLTGSGKGEVGKRGIEVDAVGGGGGEKKNRL